MQMYTRPNYYYVDRKPHRLMQKTKRTEFNGYIRTNTRPCIHIHAYIRLHIHIHKIIHTLNEIIPRYCISKYYDNVMRYSIRLNPT